MIWMRPLCDSHGHMKMVVPGREREIELGRGRGGGEEGPISGHTDSGQQWCHQMDVLQAIEEMESTGQWPPSNRESVHQHGFRSVCKVAKPSSFWPHTGTPLYTSSAFWTSLHQQSFSLFPFSFYSKKYCSVFCRQNAHVFFFSFSVLPFPQSLNCRRFYLFNCHRFTAIYYNFFSSFLLSKFTLLHFLYLFVSLFSLLFSFRFSPFLFYLFLFPPPLNCH